MWINTEKPFLKDNGNLYPLYRWPPEAQCVGSGRPVDQLPNCVQSARGVNKDLWNRIALKAPTFRGKPELFYTRWDARIVPYFHVHMSQKENVIYILAHNCLLFQMREYWEQVWTEHRRERGASWKNSEGQDVNAGVC